MGYFRRSQFKKFSIPGGRIRIEGYQLLREKKLYREYRKAEIKEKLTGIPFANIQWKPWGRYG